MFKKIMLISIAVLALAYLVFSIFFLNRKAETDMLCKDLRVQIMDTLERHYLNSEEIKEIIKKAGIETVGQEMASINTEDIKAKLEENKLIKKVDCFKTIDGSIMVKVYQRIPILRIFSDKGSFYVDNEGETMPVPRNFAAYVPVASGSIDDEFAKTELYSFVEFLRNDKFWNSQIEQIYVAPNKDIELIPRVGNHRIVLGKIADYEANLDKLKLFYDKGLNKIGWNRYSVINLKYKNQVVCTKAS